MQSLQWLKMRLDTTGSTVPEVRGAEPPGTGGGLSSLLETAAARLGGSLLTCLLRLWQAQVPWLSCAAVRYCCLSSQKL